MIEFASDKITAKTKQNVVLLELCLVTLEGFQDSYKGLSPYWCYRESLFMYDEIFMYKDCAMIPSFLRETVFDSRHSAHQ